MQPETNTPRNALNRAFTPRTFGIPPLDSLGVPTSSAHDLYQNLYKKIAPTQLISKWAAAVEEGQKPDAEEFFVFQKIGNQLRINVPVPAFFSPSDPRYSPLMGSKTDSESGITTYLNITDPSDENRSECWIGLPLRDNEMVTLRISPYALGIWFEEDKGARCVQALDKLTAVFTALYGVSEN